jgi:uncharacterized peroxidase-related enzyme
MRLTTVTRAVGLQLACDLPATAGRVPLLARGAIITDRYARALAAHGIHAVWVEDELSAGIEPVELLPEADRAEAAAHVRGALDSARSAFATRQPLGHGALADLARGVDDIARCVADTPEAALVLEDLAAADQYTHRHSVNVTALGLLIARIHFRRNGWLDYRGLRRYDRLDERMSLLGMGLLLHDIGKMAVPAKVLNKPGPLDQEEWALMRGHPEAGVALLNTRSMSPLVMTVIRDHHERLDGSGYPRGIADGEIHQFASIAAVADVYDAITSERPYKPPARRTSASASSPTATARRSTRRSPRPSATSSTPTRPARSFSWPTAESASSRESRRPSRTCRPCASRAPAARSRRSPSTPAPAWRRDPPRRPHAWAGAAAARLRRMSTATERISWFPVPEEAELPDDLQGLFRAARERIGFVPNVFRAYSFRPERLSAWFAHFRAVMEGTPGLSVAEREMIAVVVSMANGCLYCLVAHGAALREAWGDPVMADRITLDWRRADGLSERQRAICALAEKVTKRPLECEERDLEGLRAHGLADEDAWDVIEVAAMYNFTNRLALATGQIPNAEYHALAR